MTTESPTEEARYIVAWTPNSVLVRWPCVVCGGETGKQDILAVAYAGSQSRENKIGMVCDLCVEAGAAEVVARLTQQAEHLEAVAAEVRRDVAASWQFPSEEQTRTLHQDWEGHKPLPSTLFGKSEHVTSGDLMPSGYLDKSNPLYGTCYPGCPRCAEMAAQRLHTVATENRGSEERGGRPLLPPDDAAPPEVRDDHATEVRAPIDVPVAFATIQPLAWEDDEQVSRTLRFVTVEVNLAVTETVSVVLSSPPDHASHDPEDYRRMVFFDLEPADAGVLADELRRAADESVVPCPGCGRALASMRAADAVL